ncbi:hypothetical protein [Halorubrum salsamenti]|uniref:hypothetical protein n=1 Tax=Halorubrum salsamenti TaxID=2583990 RepID=UPI0011A24634|nr:hypothetical protein [Halorubrum salsamenti]
MVDQRRRRALESLTAGLVALSGCNMFGGDRSDGSGTDDDGPGGSTAGGKDVSEFNADKYDVEFDRVVNAVDDLGMDPSGKTPIDDALSDAFETGTRIEFPPGDYTVTEEAATDPPRNPSRFGMVGLGESHRDVRFHFPNADNEKGFWFVYQVGGEDVLLANFSIDMTDDLKTSVSIRFDPNDGGLIEDVEWTGFVPPQTRSYGQLLRCNVLASAGADRKGVNTIRRVTIGRGGTWFGGHEHRTGTSPGTTYARHYPGHIGEVVYEDVHFEQCGGNALRSTNNEGVITIKGGLFRNNDVSSIRLQGGKHPEKVSTVTGTKVVMDHDDIRYPTAGTQPYHGAGIVVDSYIGESGVVFEDCEIEYRNINLANSHYRPWGVVRLTNTGKSNPGGFTMRNCRIKNDTNAQTIWLQSVNNGAGEPYGVTLENLDITVTSETQSEGAVCLIGGGRDGSRISNCCILAQNGNFDGVHVNDCDNVIVAESNIFVSGQPVSMFNTSGDVRNITKNSSCDDKSASNDVAGPQFRGERQRPTRR